VLLVCNVDFGASACGWKRWIGRWSDFRDDAVCSRAWNDPRNERDSSVGPHTRRDPV